MLIVIALMLLCITPIALAAGGPSVDISSIDYVSNIVYHADGTISYGTGQGFYTIVDPTQNSPILSANVMAYSGKTDFIDTILPQTHYNGTYEIDQANVRIPLLVKETITPATLTQGAQQQVNLTVEIKNVAAHDVTGFKYTEHIPAGLTLASDLASQGVITIDNNITWTVASIPAGSTYTLDVSLKVTPQSSIYFPEAYIWYKAGDSSSSGAFRFSSSTITSLSVQKSHADTDIWDLFVSVPDVSDFALNVTQISVYRSDANKPFNMISIREYAPYVILDPGESWDASLVDSYAGVPAYFMKVSYQMPFTLDASSQPLTPARTDPFTVTLKAAPSGSGGGSTSNPYVPPRPTATLSPSPTSQPYVAPVIEFVEPKPDATIHTNNTTLEAWITIPNSSGFVVFYSSRDNESWTYIGRSSIVDNTARLYLGLTGDERPVLPESRIL